MALLKKIFSDFYYLLTAAAAAVFLVAVYLWLLQKNSTAVNFYLMYGEAPFYFWPYTLLTFLSVVLFGISAAVSLYAWQNSAWRKNLASGGAGALGAFSGALASACPTCGAFLLSFFGAAGGLAFLPFKGLEIKLLSVLLLSLSLWLTLRYLNKSEACEACVAPARPAGGPVVSEPEETKSFAAPLAVLLATLILGSGLLKTEAAAWREKYGGGAEAKVESAKKESADAGGLMEKIAAEVLPAEGFRTRVVLGDALPKLVAAGVIDLEKFRRLYEERGGLSENQLKILTEPSREPLVIRADNAGFLVNVLWAVGLSNKTEFNKVSPLNGDDLFRFASTGGWRLGKEDNGGSYFNRVKAIELTPAQEAKVLEMAKNIYRPCCNNSTFFQDCNHGSAMLGLLELGVSQGISEEELYRAALAFNSFWFPSNYVSTAAYFKVAKETDWSDVDPRAILGIDYSSASGWNKNIGAEVEKLGLVPKRNGGGCGA
ncbi:MAG: hypothetical protein HZA37_00855 [Parcubacteria group bacterium]|nr:hypothetical protein [Parcubacteria group bacterium]